MKTADKKNKGLSRLRRNDLIFYICLVIVPSLQFFLMYVCVNVNAILLAFQKIDAVTMETTWTMSTLKEAFLNFKTPMMLKRLGNSVKMYFTTQSISMALSLLFSNYIYKKYPGWGKFRVILYIPYIISGVVTTTLFRFFVDRAVPDIMQDLFGLEMEGLLSGPKYRYEAIIFYTIWLSFGTSVLLYSNRMSSISVDVVEAASLDGASGFKEFIYITFPHLYNLFTTFLVTSIVGIFTAEYSLFTFGSSVATMELQTIGYWFFTQTYDASRTSDTMFTILSATGIMITLIVAPLTIFVKHTLEKIGPSED